MSRNGKRKHMIEKKSGLREIAEKFVQEVKPYAGSLGGTLAGLGSGMYLSRGDRKTKADFERKYEEDPDSITPEEYAAYEEAREDERDTLLGMTAAGGLGGYAAHLGYNKYKYGSAMEKQSFAGLIGAGAGGIIGAANLPDDATPQERARYATRGAIRGGGIGSGMSAGLALGELGRRMTLKGQANPSMTRQVIATLLPMLGGGIGSYAGYEIADEFARNPALGTDDEPDAGDKAKADKREERMEKEKQGSDGILSGLLGPSEAEKAKAIEEEKLEKAVARNMRERLARRIAKEKVAEDIAYLGSILEKEAKRGLWDNVHAKRKRGEKPAKKGDKDYPDEKSWKKTTKEAALKSLVLEKIAKSPAWQRKAGKNSEGGLNAKGRASYNKSTGGNLKAPVTSKKPKGKAKKRKASFCARMGGMKKKNTSKATANDPDSRINKSLRKWNC